MYMHDPCQIFYPSWVEAWRQAWNQCGNPFGVLGILGEDLAQMLFFVLNHRKVDEHEDGGEKESQTAATGSHSQARGHQ